VPCGRVAAVGAAVFACLAVLVGTPGAQAAVAPARTPTPTPTPKPAKAPARTPPPTTPAKKAPARAPSEPPLSPGGTTAASSYEAEASASSSGGDSLVDNGLGSPLCEQQATAELSAASARNCRISGFEAAQAPTGDYAFDVHINTGVTKWGNYLSASAQDTAQWGWMLLVAIVHGVIVMLEWCYTIDLLESSEMRGVTNGLRETQATFTQPWLVLALAVASVLALYHGIVRRQVTETLGQTLLMAAMMLGGFWVILNPLGTVGALGAWASEASLGTLGAVAAGTPDHSERTLADSMGSIFNGAIGGPWCYLEFGNVRWCEDPALRDRRLYTAALKIAATEQAAIGPQSAELLGNAQTNGELFLALPANGPQRNSINHSSSLFNVLCGGSEEPCQGPTAAEAEFRTQGGTAARVIGLFLIWISGLGMVLLLGYLALCLLGAAIASLFLLLLAPAAVIAPALGDGGRSVFKRWAARLLGAVCSKLIYSFLLGIVLLMQQTLLSISVFGWWAQSLLVSAMWWGAFLKRRQLLGFAHGTQPGSRGHGIGGLRLASRLMAARELGRVGGMVKRKLSPPAPSAEKRQQIADAARGRAKTIEDGQVGKGLEQNYRDAQAQMAQAPEIQQRISDKQTQLAYLKRNHGAAREKEQEIKRARKVALADPTLSSGVKRKIAAARFDARFGDEERSHRRRAAEYKARMDRVQGEITAEQGSFTAARQMVTDGDNAKSKTGKPYTPEQAAEHAKLVDAQAQLPERGKAGVGGAKRNYAKAAGLVGYGVRRYEDLDAGGKRVAQLEVDRELARLKAVRATAKHMSTPPRESLAPREQNALDQSFDRTVEQQVSTGAPSAPSPRVKKGSPPKGSPPGSSSRHNSRTERRSAGAGESGPVRDAREVAAHRRRQLGREGRR
jgi:hypothetical protein